MKNMNKIRNILLLASIALLLCGCRKHEDVFFDTPFVRIEGATGQTSFEVDKNLDNLLVDLRIILSASNNYFTEPITVEYDVIVGSGLQEGVDFRIQQSTMSPVTFSPGNYSMPVRVLWYKTEGFDPSKDNTLTLRLKGTSNPAVKIGLPGPNSSKTEFIFTKI